jgi:hypothetical protein
MQQKDDATGPQWLTHVVLATWGLRSRELQCFGGQPGQIVWETPISKITRTKWNGDMFQAIEHLLCKQKALSSNSSSTYKKMAM